MKTDSRYFRLGKAECCTFGICQSQTSGHLRMVNAFWLLVAQDISCAKCLTLLAPQKLTPLITT
ncbi:hypothetical protein DMC47_01110 [Nostoc sp. 3335mG]|nr:hypothetical protein DMC47_01110 [Nostoc sp. 3335mG]